MPAYVVVQIVVEDLETYERYKTLAPPSIYAPAKALRLRSARTEMLLVESGALPGGAT